VKTDRRDARALAEACVLGAYRRAHRLSDEQRHGRARLTVRDALVRTRTGYIAVARSLLRQHGQYERRSIDGAPPLLDSPHAPTGSVPSSNSANRRMTELARPTSAQFTMTGAKTKRASPRRAGSETTVPA